MKVWILCFVCITYAYLIYEILNKNFQNSLVYVHCSPREILISDAIMSTINDTVLDKYPQLKVIKAQGGWFSYSNCPVSGDCFEGGMDCLEELKLYVDGFEQPISYQGGWSVSDILDWVDTTMKALTVEVKTIEETQEIVDDNEVVALFVANNDLSVYPDMINSVNTAPNYYESLQRGRSINTHGIWDDTVFIYSKDSKVKEFYQLQINTLILFDKLNQTQRVFEGPFSAKNIRKFIGSINPMTRVSRLQWPFDSSLLNTSVSTIFLVRGNDETGYKAEKAFREAVKSLRGKMSVYIFNFVYEGNEYFDQTFKISTNELPAIRVIHPDKITLLKYAYEGNFTADDIKTFVDRFLEDKLTPYFISDPIPVNEYEYENNVRVVVAETFEKIVLDEHKDVLLIIGYQDDFLDLLALLTDKFKDVEDFVLAKINLSTNEIDGSILNTCQLRLYPKNLKHSPIIESFHDYPYEAQTDINFYVQFLKRYAFLVQETHNKLSQSEPQAFDIISWAKLEPHPTCPDRNDYEEVEKSDQEKSDQEKITDVVLSVAEGNFSKIVLDEEYDVFLVAYAPGDDIREFSKLAAQLTDVKNLVFVKIDSSVNEVAGVKECSSPVYRLYPRNKKHAPVFCATYGWMKESNFLFFLRREGTVSIHFVPEEDARYL